MKPWAVTWCLRQIGGALSTKALDALWDSFADEARADPEIRAAYNRRKAQLAKEGRA